MQIIWQLDKKYQAYYYLQQARRIQNGFFQHMRATILPHPASGAWFFPDYGLFKNPDFIKRLEKISDLKNLTIEDPILIKYAYNTIDCLPTESDIVKDQKEFTKIFPPIDKYLNQIFRHYEVITRMNIIPAKFGMGGSYFSQEDSQTEKFTANIIFRVDLGYQSIINSLLSVLIQIEQLFDDQHLGNWSNRRYVNDFIMFNTRLRDLLPETEVKGTTSFLGEYKGDLAEESAQYLASLGYPLLGSFSYKQDTILFNNKPIYGLENKEIEILKLLIDNKSHLVSFEQIGDVYWGPEAQEKFSLYSITKIIEKIRASFQENNIPQSCIQTVRKRGYLLYD